MSRAPPIFDARDSFYQYTRIIRENMNRADEYHAYKDTLATCRALSDAREWLDVLIQAVTDD